MEVKNADLLKSLRKPGLCEVATCRKACKMRCGHHIWAKGACQIDHPWNLVQVGMNLSDCKCHHDAHFCGRPSRHDFLRAVSQREGVPLEFIDQVIPAVIACPSRLPSLAMASDWLLSHFPEDVAVKAIEIVKPMFAE